MAKKEEVVRGAEVNSDGNRAVNKFRVSDAVIMVILVLLCATCVLPFVHLLAKSISGNSYVIAKQVAFFPKGINFDAYVSIFKDGSMVSSMIYSIYVTLIFTVLGMLVCTCAAYPLSKKRLKGRTFFTFILMFPMYFGAGLIPSYLLYKDLHVLDTMWVLILPLIYSPYNMLIMKTNLQSSIAEGAAVTSTPEVLQAACIMFVTIPIICIYPFVQKYFVKGTMVGAVKG